MMRVKKTRRKTRTRTRTTTTNVVLKLCAECVRE